MNKRIEKILESIKEILVNIYKQEDAEILFDIKIKRCQIADHDYLQDQRVYAHVGCDEKTICVSSSINLLSDESVNGLILHEIGHLIHLDELLCIEIPKEIDDEEIIADMIIDNIFGIHIYYDKNKVQWAVSKRYWSNPV